MSTNGHTQLKLKFVGQADFRHTDAWQLDWMITELGGKLKQGECGILISKLGKVLRFIFPAVEHDMVTTGGRIVEGKKTRVVPSKTYRIVAGGIFNPYMLQNYANDLGIELAHLKRLEQHLRDEPIHHRE